MIVLASRLRADADALANSLTSWRAPSSSSRTERTSARSKLINSPDSDEMTSECEVTGGLLASIYDFFSSTVSIEPVTAPLAVVMLACAPCSCFNTAASPPAVSFSVPASIENGISANLAEGGAEEL